MQNNDNSITETPDEEPKTTKKRKPRRRRKHYYGRWKPPKRIFKTKIPYPLTENYLLKKAFQEDGNVRFITYTGARDVEVREVINYHILLYKPGDKIEKLEIIMAFPAENMQAVKRGVKKRKSIAEKKLRSIRYKEERTEVDHTAEVGDTIQAIMRNGLVVTGIVLWNGYYNIVLRVGGTKEEGGKVILLYNHALYNFKVLEKAKPTSPIGDQDATTEENMTETE